MLATERTCHVVCLHVPGQFAIAIAIPASGVGRLRLALGRIVTRRSCAHTPSDTLGHVTSVASSQKIELSISCLAVMEEELETFPDDSAALQARMASLHIAFVAHHRDADWAWTNLGRWTTP